MTEISSLISQLAQKLCLRKGKFDGTLTQMVADRMARLIGKTESEHQEIRKSMKDLAEERGNAVHGSRREKYNYKLLEELVRRSVNEYLKTIKNNISVTHEGIVNP